MTKALLVAAALGLTISSAGACEFMRSAKKVDTTTTASTQQMSTPAPIAAEEQAKAKTLIVEEEG